MAHRADAGDEEPLHQAAGALVVAAQRPLHRGDGVVVVDRQLHGASVAARAQRHLPPDRLTVQHDLALAVGQRPVRDVEPDPELARGVHRQPPPPGIPRQHGAFLDGLARVGNQGGDVDLGPHAQAVAGRARAVGVEGEGFGARVLETCTAHRADDLLAERGDRGPDAVAVRAQVRAQPRHHQPQHVEHFRHRAHRAARPRYRRPLPQRQRGRQVVDPVHVRPLGLGQPPAAVGAQALQEPLQALGVQRAHRQRGLARSGHADHGDRPPQRHVHVDISQVVLPGPAHADDRGQCTRHGNIASRHKAT